MCGLRPPIVRVAAARPPTGWPLGESGECRTDRPGTATRARPSWHAALGLRVPFAPACLGCRPSCAAFSPTSSSRSRSSWPTGGRRCLATSRFSESSARSSSARIALRIGAGVMSADRVCEMRGAPAGSGAEPPASSADVEPSTQGCNSPSASAVLDMPSRLRCLAASSGLRPDDASNVPISLCQRIQPRRPGRHNPPRRDTSRTSNPPKRSVTGKSVRRRIRSETPRASWRQAAWFQFSLLRSRWPSARYARRGRRQCLAEHAVTGLPVQGLDRLAKHQPAGNAAGLPAFVHRGGRLRKWREGGGSPRYS